MSLFFAQNIRKGVDENNLTNTRVSRAYKFIKRIIDIILSLLGLIILFPLFIILSIWIKLDSPGPVVFKQTRVGINKQHYEILKFRTMKIDTPQETPTHLLENPERWFKKSGNFLRKTSLDELPQIINILKGEISIIAPNQCYGINIS